MNNSVKVAWRWMEDYTREDINHNNNRLFNYDNRVHWCTAWQSHSENCQQCNNIRCQICNRWFILEDWKCVAIRAFYYRSPLLNEEPLWLIFNHPELADSGKVIELTWTIQLKMVWFKNEWNKLITIDDLELLYHAPSYTLIFRRKWDEGENMFE